MRNPNAGLSFAYLALAAAVAGCSAQPVPFNCVPSCSASYVCDTQTGQCVKGTSVDLGANTGGDLAVTCTPACSKPTPFCNAGHVCVGCLADTDCDPGFVCKATAFGASCVPGCADATRCGTTDGGAARACCGNQCTDTSTDVNNCGGCGTACKPNHAVASCVGGVCKAGTCDGGWGDCNNDGKDGCETNLHVDGANCTACGMACSFANGIAGCSDGCYLKACNFGYDNCDGKDTNGCETATLSDVNNCGGCGANFSCKSPPHATSTCANANCYVTSCVQGYADCDGNGVNGCETLTATDLNNCGKCGNKCAQGLTCINGGCTCMNCTLPNATTKCVNNQCLFDACLPGYADCNNNTADGCEVRTAYDRNNCGTCGNVCPMNMPGCNMGVCSTGCLNGQQPPLACANGKDPMTGDDYTICQADCTSAYLAATKMGGGKYHILAICQSYGYSQYGMYGGTCGDVCGYCNNKVNSCMNPQNPTKWDSGGMSCGADALGPILCYTVQWQCLK